MRTITFKGDPLTLAGRLLNEEETVPDFRATALDLKGVTLFSLKNKVKVITSFPSLDTPVCDLQVKEFNARASDLGDEVAIIAISKDLPFAQKRFCDAYHIKNIQVWSDYKTSSFGINYGLLIKELNLLARAVLIVDKGNVLRSLQIVPELTHAPDYQAAMESLQEALGGLRPAAQTPSRCMPCEKGTPPLSPQTVQRLMAQHRGWELVDDKKLKKEFRFKGFAEAKYFVDLVSVIAEEQAHHPAIAILYNKVRLTLTTHASGGLTENDFIMAGILDTLQS
jgi:thiol peroxidase